jgi:hypothetical protein
MDKIHLDFPKLPQVINLELRDKTAPLIGNLLGMELSGTRLLELRLRVALDDMTKTN